MKAPKMQLRMSARVLAAAGALALTTTLSSCGFDYATDRVYTPAAGVNDRDADVDVLGATVVSAQEGSGTFVASFANNVTDEPAEVTELSGEGLEVVDFQPVEIPAGGLVNLAEEGGIVVTGELAAGDFVTLTLGLSGGDTVEMDVPVMPSCNEWEGLDESGSAAGAGSGSEAESEDQCSIEHTEVEH